MKITLGDVRYRSRIPQALSMCPEDARIPQYMNESIQRLRTKMLSIGTYGKFRLCITDGCVTLPVQLASIERIAVSGVPIRLHDQFFEFLDNGLGTRNACPTGGDCGYINEANLRGYFPSFADIRGASKKLRFACDLSTDVGKTVLALGYDENGNWIRTVQSGNYADGELIVLAQAPGTDSTKFFSSLTGVQFTDVRDGQVWLWERNTIDATSRLIGSYQYFETVPSYSRYFLPGICANSGSGCATTTVEIIGRLEYFPVVKDTDVLMIGNIPALKNMAVAVKTYEEAVSIADLSRAAAFEAMAVKELDSELEYYLGEGREVGMNIQGSNIDGVHPVPTLL